MNQSKNAAHVVALLRSDESVETYAAQHGLDPATLHGWKDVYLAGLEAALSQRPPRRWRFALMGALAVVAALVPATVRAGNCAALLPAPLATFCSDEPALASEMNANLKYLADNLIGRTGPIGGSNSTQDIRQRATAIWYADDGSFNFNAASVDMGNATASGTVFAMRSGDVLALNSGNAFEGGTVVDGNLRVNASTEFGGAATARGSLQVDGNLSSSSNLGINGASSFNGVASFNSRPLFNAGFTRRNCRDVYGPFGGSNGYSGAFCNDGEYMNGLRCRDNGFNSLECMAYCCSP